MQFLTSVAFVFLVMVGPSLGGQAPAFQNDDFRITTKKTATLWHNIPFYAAGDMAQYQATMARNRDEVRGQMLGELTGVLDEIPGAWCHHHWSCLGSGDGASQAP